MKKITKLNDVAFHLINKVNKKKLKINTLLIKNWEKIFGENHNKVKIKKITFLGKDNLLNFELNEFSNFIYYNFNTISWSNFHIFIKQERGEQKWNLHLIIYVHCKFIINFLLVVLIR